MNKQLATYQRAQVSGASQRDLIVMCYKGGIKYLVESRQKLETGDINGFSESIEKAHRVIVHLYTTLDMDKGGEIAAKLAELYAYLINQIYLLNATKSVDLFDGIIGVMTTLKEGWEGIDSRTLQGGNAGSVAQETPAQQVVSVQI
jgi:flagellar protein FliS